MYKTPQFNNAWDELMASEFQKDYFQSILQFLNQQLNKDIIIYPPVDATYAAFNRLAPENVKVVLLGQDPYHGPGQAQGLSFSVPKSHKIPPSLRNVYKELKATIPGFVIPAHGNLEAWASQGVLLLNSILTVEHKTAAAHRSVGWDQFTDAVIYQLSRAYDGLVFMLWGNYAKKKAALIPEAAHLILTAAHPSPLARNAFLGCNHFRLANQYLKQQGRGTIDWTL